MADWGKQPHARASVGESGGRTLQPNTAPTRESISRIILALVVLAVALVAALVGYIVLSSTPAFTITSIDAVDTEHLSRENIAKLANVEEGTTLLTLDEEAITANLKRNPWVGSVTFVREFPDRLKIEVTERKVDLLVKMNMGSVCWCLGDDNVWIEPVNLTVQDGQSADDVALSLAQSMGALLVIDVPTSVSPEAGAAATDEVLKAVASYRDQFSDDFHAQIMRFSCPSVESISCTLRSGVEVSLGAPSSISVKESVISEILEKHPNQVTYINVRVPSQPSYRKLGTEAVDVGTGIIADLDVSYEEPAAVPDESGDSAEQQQEGDVSQEGEATSAEGQDNSEMILGEDGNYYTYEQYWGLE